MGPHTEEGMRPLFCFVALLFCFIVFVPTSRAQTLAAPNTNWFLGLGGHAGMEVFEITSFGGGVSLPFGYHINKNISVYGMTDVFITNDSGINYVFASFMPMATYRFYKWFSVYGGAGYALMHPSRAGRIWDFRPSTTSYYHGLRGEFGFGYNPQVSKRVVVAPQIGVQYTRIANDDLLIPLVRINIILNL